MRSIITSKVGLIKKMFINCSELLKGIKKSFKKTSWLWWLAHTEDKLVYIHHNYTCSAKSRSLVINHRCIAHDPLLSFSFVKSWDILDVDWAWDFSHHLLKAGYWRKIPSTLSFPTEGPPAEGLLCLLLYQVFLGVKFFLFWSGTPRPSPWLIAVIWSVVVPVS